MGWEMFMRDRKVAVHDLAWCRGCGSRRNEQAHIASGAHRREDARPGSGRLGVELHQHWLVVGLDEAVLDGGGNYWPFTTTDAADEETSGERRSLDTI